MDGACWRRPGVVAEADYGAARVRVKYAEEDFSSDPARNTAAEREAGRVYFDFEFDPPSPAERITFRSQLVSG